MGYYKDENGQKVIKIATHNVLPIITFATLTLGTILFLIFAFMVGAHYGETTYPASPTPGNEFNVKQSSGLWEICTKYVYTNSNWDIKNVNYGLSTGGIASMVFIIGGIVLYGVNAIKLQSSNEKYWFKLLSGFVVVLIIVVVWTMVHQYFVFPVLSNY